MRRPQLPLNWATRACTVASASPRIIEVFSLKNSGLTIRSVFGSLNTVVSIQVNRVTVLSQGPEP